MRKSPPIPLASAFTILALTDNNNSNASANVTDLTDSPQDFFEETFDSAEIVVPPGTWEKRDSLTLKRRPKDPEGLSLELEQKEEKEEKEEKKEELTEEQKEAARREENAEFLRKALEESVGFSLLRGSQDDLQYFETLSALAVSTEPNEEEKTNPLNNSSFEIWNPFMN